MWRKLAIILMGVGLIAAAHASPELKAGEKSLRLSKWHTEVNVVGNLAVTTMTMDFFNDTNRILEGQLTFPLDEGQTVSGYAMDVNGTMRPAVVVEKDKGRQVFENIVRRGIDPGLIEKTSGNNFRTRVYPIPAKGHKRIRVTFEQILDEANNALRYRLPLELKAPVDNFSIKATVVKRDIAPVINEGGLEMAFDKVTENFVAKFSRKNYRPEGGLNFSLPLGQKIETYVEDGTHWQDLIEVTNTYFLSRIPIKVEAQTKQPPKNVAIFWDVSGSGEKVDRKHTYITLQSYLKKNRATFTVHTFANDMLDSKSFKAGHTNSLVRHLSRQKYDGGTQLGALDFSEVDADEIILVTDGVSNIGKSEPTLGGLPVYVINSAATAEHSRLKAIAQSSGGAYLNMKKLEVKEALALLNQQSVVMQKPEVISGEIKHVYPSSAVTVNPAQRANLVGKLVSDSAALKITFTQGGRIVASKLVTLEKGKANTGLVSRIWAQIKLAELELNPQQNEAEMVLLGKDYGLVTKFTSLIVLDRLQDYVENDIVPPRELADMRNQYFAQKKEIAARRTAQETDHLNTVRGWWQAEKRWWDTDFKVRRPLKREKAARSLNGAGSTAPSRPVMRPSPRTQSVTTTANTNEAAEQIEEEETMADGEIAGDPYVVAPEVDGLIVTSETAYADADDRAELHLAESAGEREAPGDFTLGVRDETGQNRLETKAKKRKPGGPTKSIKLAKWDPKTPYLKQLRKAKKPYQKYLSLRRKHAKSSAFYLDVADFFKEKKQPKVALRVLSNIAEMDLDNPQLLRILGHRLAQLGENDLALSVFERVLALRPEEPQSYRDAALIAEKVGQLTGARDLLWKVVQRPWGRFDKIELIALVELNRLFAKHPELPRTGISQDFVAAMPLDVRIVMTWDADATDIDLWVTDPYGEKCYYGHPNTRIGGRMSRDFTQGYGPETFRLKKAVKGEYRIQANYYGSRQQHLAGATTLQVEIITDYGKATEKREQVTLRLKDKKEVVDVGTISLGN